jgi:hypothetical protein
LIDTASAGHHARDAQQRVQHDAQPDRHPHAPQPEAAARDAAARVEQQDERRDVAAGGEGRQVHRASIGQASGVPC